MLNGMSEAVHRDGRRSGTADNADEHVPSPSLRPVGHGRERLARECGRRGLTIDERADIFAMAAEGIAVGAIARAADVNPVVVNATLVRHAYRAGERITEDERRLIAQLHTDGYRVELIAAHLGRSLTATKQILWPSRRGSADVEPAVNFRDSRRDRAMSQVGLWWSMMGAPPSERTWRNWGLAPKSSTICRDFGLSWEAFLDHVRAEAVRHGRSLDGEPNLYGVATTYVPPVPIPSEGWAARRRTLGTRCLTCDAPTGVQPPARAPVICDDCYWPPDEDWDDEAVWYLCDMWRDATGRLPDAEAWDGVRGLPRTATLLAARGLPDWFTLRFVVYWQRFGGPSLTSRLEHARRLSEGSPATRR